MFERLRRMANHQTDAELALAIARGNGDAMAELYRRHGALVYRFTLRMSQNATIAEEITQEVFLALLRHPAHFDPQRAALSTWLCAIARRQLWKHLARNERFVSIELEDEPFDPISPEPGPAEWLTRNEAIASVRDGIDRLSLPLKEVILLCELEGLTYEQAAQILTIPIGTVRSRLSRAKGRLALLLRNDTKCAEKENSQR
jgi:RNA polymerase sigma-70 factor, ECF subfamily